MRSNDLSTKQPLLRTLSLASFVLALAGACIDEDELELEVAELDEISPPAPAIPLDPPELLEPCEGYGWFDNQQYDCGWKRGYEDYVYHYNWILAAHELGDCYEIYVLQYEDGGAVSLVAQSIPSGYFVPGMVADEFQGYVDMITATRNDSDFKRGQYDGYMAIRGQEPYSAGGNCGSSSPFE